MPPRRPSTFSEFGAVIILCVVNFPILYFISPEIDLRSVATLKISEHI